MPTVDLYRALCHTKTSTLAKERSSKNILLRSPNMFGAHSVVLHIRHKKSRIVKERANSFVTNLVLISQSSIPPKCGA